MDWTWYLFGFNGRINRAKYWLAGLVILCLMLAFVWLAYLTLMIDFVAHAMGTAHGKGKVSFGFGIDDVFLVFDPAAWRALSLAKLPLVLVKAGGLAMFFWMYLATSIKRLHDRDRSGWWLVPFVVAPHLFNHFSDDLPGGYFMMVAGAIMFVLMIWGFVELYCLRGTKWTNRFGPTRSARSRCASAPIATGCARPPHGARTARSKSSRTKLARRRFGVLIPGHD